MVSFYLCVFVYVWFMCCVVFLLTELSSSCVCLSVFRVSSCLLVFSNSAEKKKFLDLQVLFSFSGKRRNWRETESRP